MMMCRVWGIDRRGQRKKVDDEMNVECFMVR